MKQPDPLKRVIVPLYMTPEQRRLLKTFTASRSLSMQNLLHDAIDEYLAKRNHSRIFNRKDKA